MNNSATNKSLLVLQFNANGLKNHVNILQNVLYDKRIDIALITETHFTKYTHIFIPGYQLIKANAIFYKRFYYKLENHVNPLIKGLHIPSLPGNPRRRLKRKWCRDHLT